jgi:hypothetical protein
VVVDEVLGTVVGGRVVTVTTGARSEYRLDCFGYQSGGTTIELDVVDTSEATVVVVAATTDVVVVDDAVEASSSERSTTAVAIRTTTAIVVTASAITTRGGNRITPAVRFRRSGMP